MQPEPHAVKKEKDTSETGPQYKIENIRNIITDAMENGTTPGKPLKPECPSIFFLHHQSMKTTQQTSSANPGPSVALCSSAAQGL